MEKDTFEDTTPIPGPWERPGEDGAPSLSELDDTIAELAATIDAATYRLLVAIAEFDRREGWALTGARSCAHWLSYRIGLELSTARDRVRVARKLEELPLIGGCMARGELSYSKVRALARIATPENEAELVTMARSATASELERLVRAYREVGKADVDRSQRQQDGRYLQLRHGEDGSVIVEGRLPPEVGALLQRALEAAEAEGVSTETPAQRRADALGVVAERALVNTDGKERGEPYHVVVHIDAEVLEDRHAEGQCSVEHGSAISAETARRLCCDAPVVGLFEAQGQPLSVGRKSRRVSAALWRALRSRDQTCAVPGCEQTLGLRVHHVEHWADGGETTKENCICLCRRCHWLVHEGGFRVTGRAPDGLVFENRIGQRLGERFEPPELPSDPAGALRAQHVEQGIEIDARTNLLDRWWGDAMDLDTAVQVLLAREGDDAALPSWSQRS